MTRQLGRPFPDGAIIARQGDPGDCMFFIQEGRVELLVDTGNGPVPLALLGAGDFFGEMCFGEGALRLTTARAVQQARVLTVDRATLLRRINEDPCLAIHMLETMARRMRQLEVALASLRGSPAAQESPVALT
jgi:CRP/FNR family transcriptional regulator, cyclic AMP receptor protein